MSEMQDKRWYVLQTQNSFESRAQKAIEKLSSSRGLEEFFGEVLVPTESVIELKGGKKVTTKKKFFPGYIFANMVVNQDTYGLIRSIPYITGFVGGSAGLPAPINEDELLKIMDKLKDNIENPRHRYTFDVGESVRVTDGPFAEFTGVVERVDYSKNRLQVLIAIFGRATPIDLGFNQVVRESE